ncbi:hypothetical protein, partial [Bradyrhizobium liaoningense]|uniref:hypothetical protein n=1 Tax=Bradyrhizobium liaoningense TaxID=43992 RepID=UPI001BA68CAC
MAQLNVNLSDVNEKDAEGGGGVIIPRDRYLLNIVEGEVKRNSKNTGDLFEYKAEVVEGDFAGVKFFGNINVTHQTVTAQKIGQAQLAALAEATGCVSAWNKDPVFGVIGIQSGPRDKGPQWLPSSHG